MLANIIIDIAFATFNVAGETYINLPIFQHFKMLFRLV